MSLSGNKENIEVTRLGSQNASQHTDWVQCTPVTPSIALAASRKKASWKPVDDEMLVECLRQQQAAGHQSDTGFKPVAWTACVLALKDSEKQSGGAPKTAKGCKDHFGTVSMSIWYALDGTDRICCQLKEHFLIVQTLRGLSGFGWDDAKHMVTAPDDVWDQYLAVSWFYRALC